MGDGYKNTRRTQIERKNVQRSRIGHAYLYVAFQQHSSFGRRLFYREEQNKMRLLFSQLFLRSLSTAPLMNVSDYA